MLCEICIYKSITLHQKEIVMNQTSKVAVIGTGNIGTAVATNLVKGGRPLIVADRKIEKVTNLAQ